jgi:threonine efflux protein
MESLIYLTLLALAGIVSPGPDFVAVSQASLLKNKEKSIYLFILGIAIGNGFWVFGALLGIERVFHTYPQALYLLKLCGGLYLCYLGLKSFGLFSSAANPNNAALFGGVYKGLWVTLSNPKAALFYLAILSANLPKNMDKSMFFLIISVPLVTFIWFSFISSILRCKNVYSFIQSKEASINKVFGAFFLYFGCFQIVKIFL